MSHPSEPADLIVCTSQAECLKTTVTQPREASAAEVQPLPTLLSAHFSVAFVSMLGDWGVDDKGLRLQPTS